MFRFTVRTLKKGFEPNPGPCARGGKNLAWKPKMPPSKLERFVPLNAAHPPRRPNSWQPLEFRRLGLKEWPKAVGFYNAGDNFELTPEMMYRLFLRNKDEEFWTPQNNEQTIVHLLPFVEADPAVWMPRVDEVFQAHLRRFGVDHVIYNAVMQGCAFAKDLPRCLSLFEEMQTHDLVPNAQSYVNLMLAVYLSDQPREQAEAYFREGVTRGAISSVMRLDTEFQMWWDQFGRLGSFTRKEGFLSNKEEGAKPRPKDLWALWGWDRDERKFISQEERIKYESDRRIGLRAKMRSTIYTKYLRQPWAKYKGLLRPDTRGPSPRNRHRFDDFPDKPPVGSTEPLGITIAPTQAPKKSATA